MKRIQSNQGFTLVELIVVITILAILGTIGFISLQGYSAQSRDSKRASDMRALNTAVNVTNTNGIGLLNLIVQDTTRELAYASTNVGGTLLTSTTYEAGRIDFGVINQN